MGVTSYIFSSSGNRELQPEVGGGGPGLRPSRLVSSDPLTPVRSHCLKVPQPHHAALPAVHQASKHLGPARTFQMSTIPLGTGSIGLGMKSTLP